MKAQIEVPGTGTGKRSIVVLWGNRSELHALRTALDVVLASNGPKFASTATDPVGVRLCHLPDESEKK